MIRGWYHNIQSEQRFLSVEEVAAACCITTRKIKDWFAGKIATTAQTNECCIDASKVVSFLVRNSMPVPPLLLPPETRKILLIATHDYEFLDHGEEK